MEYTAAEMRIVLIGCSIACFIAPLLSTMMNLSLVNIGEDFDIGSHDLAYVNTSFLLSSVIFMVPMACLGDILGKKRMFITGLAIVSVTCIMASLSPTFWFLIACRVAMAAGTALVMTIGMSMVVDVYPPAHRGGALGIQTMCVYTGLALGPTIGGFMNDLIGWHLLFLIVLPLAVASAILLSRFKKEIRPAEGKGFDKIGTLFYALAMFLMMGGVINLPAIWAWPSMLAGAFFLVMFIRREMRTEDVILHVDLFKDRVFSGSCLAAFLCYASSYSISFFLALYLQSIGELSSSEAGLVMLAQPLVQAITTPIFGSLSDRVPDKRILPTAGIALLSVELIVFSTLGLEADIPIIVAAMMVGGLGFGLFSTPNTSVIMGAVPRQRTGDASAVLAVTRQSGMMVSMGLAMMTISLIMGSMDHLVPENYPQFLDVIRITFIACLGMSVVAAIASLLRKQSSARIVERPNFFRMF